MKLKRLLGFIPNNITVIISLNSFIIYCGKVNGALENLDEFDVMQINPIDDNKIIIKIL